MSQRPTVLLDEQLLGLDVFLRDLGWKTIKVKPGRSKDEVLASAKQNGYVLVMRDVNLASRCRVQEVKVVQMGLEEEARMHHQILQANFASKER